MTLSLKADLHIHSTASDGSSTPLEIIEQASSLGLNAVSITDHDTVAAYKENPEIFQVALEKGIQLLPGAEFSTTFKGSSIHILAYSFLPDNAAIHTLISRHIERRMTRNEEILSLLKKHGMPISLTELSEQTLKKGSWGRPHIAEVMVKKEYVTSIEMAFKDYLGDGCLCFAEGPPFLLEETLEILKSAEAFSVIAHPHLVKEKRLIDPIIELGIDGIECFYGKQNKDKCLYWKKIADKKGLLVTGGSDFHGALKPYLSLGESLAPPETFEVLYNHYLSLSNREIKTS